MNSDNLVSITKEVEIDRTTIYDYSKLVKEEIEELGVLSSNKNE